ncbi:MAG: FHA domain-containing protein [Gemmataceae bacterium]
MGRPRDESFDPKLPTLIVKYGTTKQKYRPLRRDVVVLGRGAGCDIGLVSPEVAPVHCILVRVAGGWILRDCSGRATRLNGQAVTEEPLRDGDTITIGTFSFEAHLPPQPPPGAPARYAHMERSRRRIAERAIRMRARVHELERDDAARARQQEELGRMEGLMRSARVEQEKRRAELDAFARRLKRERQQLRDVAHEEEADVVRQRVDLDHERRRMEQMQAEMQGRLTDLENVTESLEAEREALRAEQEQVVREREYLDQQRKELVRHRQAETDKDTRVDAPTDRLESARRLLQTIKVRREQLAD